MDFFSLPLSQALDFQSSTEMTEMRGDSKLKNGNTLFTMHSSAGDFAASLGIMAINLGNLKKRWDRFKEDHTING